ncbi:MAG: radical SAM protein [Archaeoglobaceae archaeon]|nr:radical SAM protein [Archaeoglobaceae archaeon]MDW7989077.1 radical SAM protein [Archaeoglobaceae archaeon]
MKEAKLYRRVGDSLICQLCYRFCRLKNGESGFCKVRLNKDGKLYTLTYGKISTLESRPIEIKPFYHFKPGSTSMTFSTYSCNFICPWCQNWRISRALPEGREVSPQEIVDKAFLYGDESICASLNEPTLLYEFLLEVFRLAKEKGLLNTMVSNGYSSILALKELKKAGLNALKVDIKGGKKTYEMLKVKDFAWKTAKEAIKMDIHVEIVNLIVTDVNEDQIQEIVDRHLKMLGKEIPIHFTRYFPAFMHLREPTKIETLEKAVELAKKEGISFAYLGNVPGHRFENTYCPDCGEILIKRYSYTVLEKRIENGRCWKCKREIYGIW